MFLQNSLKFCSILSLEENFLTLNYQSSSIPFEQTPNLKHL